MAEFHQHDPDYLADDLKGHQLPRSTNLHAITQELIFSPSIVRSINSVLSGLNQQFISLSKADDLSLVDFQKALKNPSQVVHAGQCGDLAILPSHGNAYFFSDSEGCYRSFVKFLIDQKIVEKLEQCPNSDPVHVVILGDFIDRNNTSLPFVELLLYLKSQYPNQIHILAGNHELYSEGQREKDGLFMEIHDTKFTVSVEDWQALKRTPFFLEFFRGQEETQGLVWKSNPESRALLCEEYVRAMKARRGDRDRETADLSAALTAQEFDQEVDFEVGVDNAEILIRNIRTEIAKRFLWDLYQVLFSGLPKAIVSETVFADHGLIPTTGIFEPQKLASTNLSPEELLFDLSRSYQLPDGEKLERITDIVWSDLDISPSPDNDPSVPRAAPNTVRKAGKVVNQAAVELFLKAIDRKILIRGHQSLGVAGYHVQGPVHTVQSSSRKDGCCLKVSLNPEEPLVVERIALYDKN